MQLRGWVSYRLPSPVLKRQLRLSAKPAKRGMGAAGPKKVSFYPPASGEAARWRGAKEYVRGFALTLTFQTVS
jgi:hypothetical protein